MNNRLQFRHHSPIFDTREEAIEYIYSQVRFAEEGLAFEDKSYGFSLFAEPLVIRYKNEADADLPSGSTPNPHLILAVGSNTNEGTQYNDNRFCIIDIDKTEADIEEIWDEISEIVKGIGIITKDTNTLKLYSEKTENGTVISGDVVVATSHIFDDARKPNVIMNTDDGLFTYVNMDYDKDNDKITFTVNGDTKEWFINNNYLIAGWYNKKDESLHLKSKDDSEIVISLESLIDEWTVEGEATDTPIVLTREEVGYGDDALHNHVEPWQDLLKADVRLADRRFNILKKSSDGRYLYVDGLANNIIFFKDGEEITVQEALTNVTKGVSNDSTNIIYEKPDGYYAKAELKYRNKENKLIFTTSNVTGGTSVEEIQLNAVKAFEKIYYDSVTENLIILYVDGSGDIQEVDVPIGQMMADWEWDIQNEGHNVKLHKQRVVAGNDKVSADAAIYNDPDNILVDKNHELFVKGTADNIRYGRGGNVEEELDKLNSTDVEYGNKIDAISGKVDTLREEFDVEVARAVSEERRIEEKIDNEVNRSTNKDNEHDRKLENIEQIIGDGFTTDGHETITYKFGELSAKTNTISTKVETNTANIGLLSAKTEAEVVRATSEEQRIEKKFDDALGGGFNVRDTVRDEFNREKEERIGEDARLQAEIDLISGKTEGKLVDVINVDHSINVDKSDAVRPVIGVNLSDEQIEGMPNIIKLNNDGLYAGVDLEYYFESGTSKNILVFKTTNGTKTFDIKTNSVIDKIYYDVSREAIIIEYTVDGHRMPDVVVPVGDLISEWRVSENTNGAIKLYKFRESGATQDVLYAESIISNHEDNILVNDNGALYVSGAQIEQNKADIEALNGRMDAIDGDIDALEDGLAAEITRATSEEARIEAKLDREIERSTSEDDDIWNALRAEIARSTEKDAEHDTNIANEIQRAQDAERELHNEISAEVLRATSAETMLGMKIDSEVERSTNKDNEHDAAIINLRNDLNAEITRSTTEDNSLRNAISAETNARMMADSVLDNKIEAEKTRATSEEARIEGKIDNEITRSTNKDNEHDTEIANLRNDLNAEISRAEGAEHDIESNITAEISARIAGDSALDTKIENEKTRATSEEARIEGKIDNEIARSTNKDSEHSTAINTLRSELTNEANTRLAADNEIKDLVHQEEDRAKSVESAITHSIEIESIARQNGDDTLNEKINTEITNRTNADSALDVKIENEKTRAIGEETRIETKLNGEISRSTTKDNDLQLQITTEATTARAAESSLRETLTTEVANRTTADANLQTQVTNEITRAQGAENTLDVKITNEKEARENEDAKIWAKIRPIEIYDTTTIHNERVRNSGETPDEIRHYVIVSQSDKNIVVADDTKGGVYATVSLDYDEPTNTVVLKGTDGMVLSTQQLGPGSLLDSITYDYEEKDLVIDYHSADGVAHSMKFPVAQLFNEWDIQNPSQGSALELHKETNSGGTGNVDILWGRVLIAGAVERPDGTIDYGDNIIRIVNNGLYASGSAITEANDTAICTRNELRKVETAVLGHDLSEAYICGEGYEYTPYEQGCYINNATSMFDADKILDTYLCSAHTRIDNVEEDMECLWKELNITQENVIGLVIPPCGMNGDGTPYHYKPYEGACFINGATSIVNAIEILDTTLCNMGGDSECAQAEVKKVENVLGANVEGACSGLSITYPTTSGCVLSNVRTFAEADAALERAICDLDITISGGSTSTADIDSNNGAIFANVRLSHGNDSGKWQSDSELKLYTINDAEFSDTNVLRAAEVIGEDVDSKYNGLYLSNIWDCGQYTENGVGTPNEKYKIDNSETAQNNFNRKYRNGVRYEN